MRKVALSFLFLYVLLAVGGVQAQVISTIAGTGITSYNGDGGAATATNISYPVGLCRDQSGNIYFTEGRRVRKLNTLGIVTIVAGTGVYGYTGDGGPATAATFGECRDIAIDSIGNLYVTDNHTVRKIDASGIITTIAGNSAYGSTGDGGPATAALLNAPWGLALDHNGNLYVADYLANNIRKIDAAGNITTVAGPAAGSTGYYFGDGGPATAAGLRNPIGIAIDKNNDLFIADADNWRIRKVSATTGIISNVAGSGIGSGFAGDGGPATAARLGAPADIAFDTTGNMFFTDFYTHRMRKVDVAGIITTIAGTGVAGFTGDGGWAVSAQVNSPYAIAIDSSGNIYFSDNGNSRIRKITNCRLPVVGNITGGSSVCVGSTLTLSDTTVVGTWSTNMAAVAGVSTAGLVTGVAAGNATIYFTATNSCGTAIDSQSVTVNPLPVLGMVSGASMVCTGSTITLSTTGTGGTWSSGATGVATVSATGVTMGVAAGNAPIMYTVSNSCGSAIDTQWVAVNPLPASGFITGATTLCAGATITLADTATGGIWFSNNTGVATIAGGVVTGVAAGNATISYSVLNSCGLSVATAVVTVNDIPSPGNITGIDTVCEGSTIALSETVSGGMWASSNVALATVNTAGVVSGVAAGSVVISYTKGNTCGSANATHPVNVIALAVCQAAGVAIQNLDKEITIFPNPNTGSFTVTVPQGAPEAIVAVYNMLGQQVAIKVMENMSGSVSLDGLSRGTYMVKVTVDAVRVVRTVVVQ